MCNCVCSTVFVQLCVLKCVFLNFFLPSAHRPIIFHCDPSALGFPLSSPWQSDQEWLLQQQPRQPTHSPYNIYFSTGCFFHLSLLVFSSKGLASHCKAETTFTFHFSILTLSNAFLGIDNREMKSESGFSFAIASQPF